MGNDFGGRWGVLYLVDMQEEFSVRCIGLIIDEIIILVWYFDAGDGVWFLKLNVCGFLGGG